MSSERKGEDSGGVKRKAESEEHWKSVFVESVSVMEGDSVTLNSDLSEIRESDEILWKSGVENSLIAEINRPARKFSTYYGPDGRFRDRLKLDNQTGSLTIMNITTEHEGHYELEINGAMWSSKTFSVSVYARLPVPVIISNSSNCSSSSGSSVCICVLLCSVVNVRDVTLSWYAGMSVLSNISASDLSINLSLPLEIECLDDSYSCVVASSFTNWTTHLNTDLCQTCPAVARLVISALVGVAAACIVVYDITSRKQERT
ncbi:hypothetical protein F2P79_013803 [Pimephales promelas]|nr:hypothetical protein F2P79_013803 [Pimephales promelas]